jgi:hypothetical protein
MKENKNYSTGCVPVLDLVGVIDLTESEVRSRFVPRQSSEGCALAACLAIEVQSNKYRQFLCEEEGWY